MVWKVYFVNTCVIVRYFRRFHHVTLDRFDVYLHAWLYVYNMERRGVRFDQIYDEIDACLVWFRVLRIKLIFTQFFVAEFPFIIKNPTETVFHRILKVSTYIGRNTNFMFPKQRLYRPKEWLGINTVLPKTVFVPSPIFHGKQCLGVLHTYFRSRYRPCIFENTESLFFRTKQALTGSVQGLYNPVQALNAFFENFTTPQYRPCILRFSGPVRRGYRLTESKKCQYRLPEPVHCRYIACFSRYWACLSRYRVCLSR